MSRDAETIHTGSNSGYAAVNVAYHLKAKRILLLGYDMKVQGDKRHFFGAHPPGMEVDSNYASFMTKFATINPADYGLEIWNVTRDTAMTCFPVYDLDEVAEVLRDTAQVA